MKRAVIEGVNEVEVSSIPLLASQQGGVAERSIKCREASADREAGVVFRLRTKRKTTPAASVSVASRYFINDAATPPCGDARRGMCRSPFRHFFRSPNRPRLQQICAYLDALLQFLQEAPPGLAFRFRRETWLERKHLQVKPIPQSGLILDSPQAFPQLQGVARLKVTKIIPAKHPDVARHLRT